MALAAAITVPVNSFTKVNPNTKPVTPDPDVGARWGKPSDLQFGFPEDGENEDAEPVGAVVNPDDRKDIVRSGVEVLFLADGTPASPWTFYCDTFVEKTVEKKKNGGVIDVTPIETTVILYVNWADAIKLFFTPTQLSKRVRWTTNIYYDYTPYHP
jgi:hypothetical protein